MLVRGLGSDRAVGNRVSVVCSYTVLAV